MEKLITKFMTSIEGLALNGLNGITFYHMEAATYLISGILETWFC